MSEIPDRNSNNSQRALQLIERTNVAPEKKRHPKKLKVRHLSDLTKQIIVERFCSLLDYDETATAMGIPGLTGRVVDAVIAAHGLATRKPPAREMTFAAGQQQRRTA